MNLPTITHINLARGWRGGEHQTSLLIRELQKAGLNQQLCVHPGSPMSQIADSLSLPALSPASLLMHPAQIAGSIAHAHEARGVYLAAWLKYRAKVNYVVTRRMQAAPRRRMLTARVYLNADQLVGISRAACIGLQQIAPSREILRIPSSHSGVQYKRNEVQELRKHLIGDANILIGHAGALVDRDKAQSVLIDAFRVISNDRSNVRLLIMGEGSDRAALEQQARGLNISFLGHIENIHQYLATLDCFVLPSRHEGLGSVLLDVMKARVPIVASNVGGIPDIIRSEHTGLLIDPNNALSLADAIVRLLDDDNLSRNLAETAFQEVEDYSPRLMAMKYIDIYRQVANKAV